MGPTDNLKMNALVVEDDTVISQLVCRSLAEIGLETQAASDGQCGLEFARRQLYDLIVLDLMLPGLDGLSFLKMVRSDGIQSKILILSAKRSVDERVSGLQDGADDYLTKPFATTELVARCQALLRRANASVLSRSITRGDISLDLVSREVRRRGELIELQSKESALLEYFMRHPNVVVTKEQILKTIWQYRFDPGTNIVDVLVFRLRNKIDRNFQHKSIQTLRGRGYVFEPA